MRNQIGISSINLNGKLGSIFTVVVEVKPDFFRNNHILSRDPKKLLFGRNKMQHSRVEVTPPVHIDKDVKVSESRNIICSLNTCPRFWEQDIYIEYSGEDFLKTMKLPMGLKNVELNTEKWKIKKDMSSISKVCKLAKDIAKWWMEEELKEIKEVWGDFDDIDTFVKENPDNPHVRKR